MSPFIVFIAFFLFLLICPAVQYAEDGKESIRTIKTCFSQSKRYNLQENPVKRFQNIPKSKMNAKLRYKSILPAEGSRSSFYNKYYMNRIGGLSSPELIDVTKFIASPLQSFMNRENSSAKILEKFPIQTVNPDPNIHYTMRYAHGDRNGTILERKALPREYGIFDSHSDLFDPFNCGIHNKEGDVSPFDVDSKKRCVSKIKPRKKRN